MTLEDLICPYFKIGQENRTKIVDLVCYGLASNHCPDCNGYDNTCELYNDYILSKAKVLELRQELECQK